MRIQVANPLKWFKPTVQWKKVYCLNCGSLFFEVAKGFKRKTVRVKCRKCKGMHIV